MVFRVVTKGQFWVVIRMVKTGSFGGWVVITVVEKGQFWVVIRMVKRGSVGGC